jgi:alpha-glucosidase
MKYKIMKSDSKIRAFATWVAFVVISGLTQAATITMTASNASWLYAMWGSPAAEPTAGNDYILAYVGSTNPGLVRVSPKGSSGNGNTIFPGDSITVPSQCRFLMKQYGGEYATIKDDGTNTGNGIGNLIMNEGSRMSSGANNGNPGATLITSLNLGQLIINGSNVLYDNNNGQAGCNINGILTGAGNLNLAKESGNSGRFLATFKSVGIFTGILTANPYIDLAFGSNTVFIGGVTLAGTGPSNGTLKVDKALQFNSGKLVANGVAVPTGVYSGVSLTALNNNLGAVYFVDGGGTLTVGQVTKAYLPQPANQSVNISVALNQLCWTNPPTDGIITCDVYFGTNPSSLPIIGSGLTSTCAAIPYTLSSSMTYYWRVDCIDSVKGLLAGDTWSFQTEIASNTLDNYSSYTGNSTLGYTFTTSSGQKLRITPSGDYIVRITALRDSETFLPDNHYEMVADHAMGGSLTLAENTDSFTVQTAADDGVEIRISKSPMRLSFYKKGTQVLLAADKKGICWSGTRTDVDFNLSDDHFFGAGHPSYGQQNALDLRGTEVQRNYGSGQAPLIVPFFMSHKGYGIFLNSMFPNRFRFVNNNEYSFGVDGQGYGGQMDYYFIIGPQIAQMLDRYTQLTGRPRLPQKSIFGLHLSDKGDPSNSGEPWWKDAITQHRAAGFPLDHIVNDNRWRAGSGAWSGSWFEWAITEGRYPDPAEWTTWTKNQGLTMTLDLNRNICDESWGWSSTFNIPNSSCSGTAAPDYSSQTVRNWNWELFWAKSLNPSLNYPGDALWMDEPDDMGCISDSVIMADGRRWAENKNYYFFLLAKAVVQQGWDNENNNSPAGIGEVKRPFVWVRGMTSGAQRYATHWTGDTNNSYTSMQQQIRAMQASGLSGFPYFNHDAGGYSDPGPDDNAYRQWSMAFGSFSPIWRPHGPGVNYRWPLRRSTVCQADARVYSKLRYELMPYTYTMAYRAYATGMPMARAMVIDYQNEPLAWSSDLQYMWGSQILIAPNCSVGNNNVTVWLPAGCDWYDYWTNTAYTGGQTLAYYAATGVQPMFVKKGSVIPRAPYALSTFWIPKDTLILDVYTGADGSFDLYEDDDVTEYFRTQNQCSITPIQYQDGCKVLTISAANGQYSGKPQSRTYKIRFYGVNQSLPMGVNGVRLPEFATEQQVVDHGYGYVYLPAEKKMIVLLQAISTSSEVVVGPVGANPDTNNDGTIDIEDLADIAVEWLNANCSLDNCWCNKADINGDSFVDIRDFAELAKRWLI